MRILTLVVILVLPAAIAGCGQVPATTQVDTADEYQDATYDRQTEHIDRQLVEYDQQLQHMEKQNERFDKLLDRWETQADRYDAILDRWEQQASPVSP